MTIRVTPGEIYNPNTFFDPKIRHSGISALEEKIDRLPRSTQAAIDELNSPKTHNRASKVRFNAFEYNTTVDGENHCLLRVYNDISRINHSCRPNAMVEWNDSPSVMAGTLHALMDIPRDEEIVISYLPRPRDCLKFTRYRRSELTQSYFFRCECEACKLGEGENEARSAALILYRSATTTRDTTTRDTSDVIMLSKIHQWTGYIQHLTDLMLLDTKLSHAYEAVADLHYMRASAALRLENVMSHCGLCAAAGSSAHHIDSTLAALREALRVDLRCLGVDHPQTMARQSKIDSVTERRRRHV